jgi:Fe-S-cluster containining protein
MGFTCQKCGKCCRELPIEVFASDIRRWLSERRSDILLNVSFLDNYPHKGTGGFYVIDTVKNPKRSCPFFNEEGLCDIHDTKPRVCKDYPYGPKGHESCPHMEEHSPRFALQADRIKRSQDRDLLDMARNRDYLLRKLVEGRRGNFG